MSETKFPQKLMEQFREKFCLVSNRLIRLKQLKEKIMKTSTAIIGGLIAIIVIGFGFYMIDIDQTEEGSMPNVDVSVEGGNLPEFDAQTGSVEVTEEEKTITVPEVNVTTDEKTVTVPGVEVTPPAD